MSHSFRRVIVLAFCVMLLALVPSALSAAGAITVDKADSACVTGSGQATPYTVVYCKIQDAVTDAAVGDTIHVGYGTYNEHVVINKSVTLDGSYNGAVGATIDGGESGTVVDITANNVTVNQFNIQGSGANAGAGDAGVKLTGVTGCSVLSNFLSDKDAGALANGILLVNADNNTVFGNAVYNYGAYGVAVVAGTGNTLENNNFTPRSSDSLDAIALANQGEVGGSVAVGSTGNLVKANTVSAWNGGRDGIFLGENCDNNQVINNLLYGIKSIGISAWRSGDHTITGNSVAYTATGLRLLGSSDNTITDNSFMQGEVGIKVDASWQSGVWYDSEDNVVQRNNLSENTTFGIEVGANQVSTVNAPNNWWGSACGPTDAFASQVTSKVDYAPWWLTLTGDAPTPTAITTGNSASIQCAQINSAAPGSTITYGAGAYPGGVIVAANGVTIDLNGATVGAGSPAFTIAADDVTLQNGILDGGSPASTSPAVLVQTGADNFTLNGVELKNWLDGVQVAGSHASLKLVNNWLHDNGTGFRFNSGVVLTGVVTIEGNLFKFNTGNGIESAVAVKAEYNSWGDIDGPAATTGGDGVSANVTATPFTFVEIFTDAAITPLNVVEGDTFTVNVQADAAGMYAAQYKLTYDSTLLQFVSIADGAFGACTANTATAGVITSRCGLLNPAADVNGTAQLVNAITFKVVPDSSHADDDSWTTYLDLKHDDGLAAAARDGIKAWVNNAGFGAPSSSDKDITDAHDGTIIIAGAAQYTGYIDLQGRTNDSGATLNVYDQAAVSGSTLKANATSASSGAYTTAYATGHQLAIGTTYYFQVDRDLYLPTTRTYTPAGTSWAHLKELINRPTTTLDNVVLLGGDATNDNLVDISDASCIGDDYSQAPSLCGTTVGSSSDVTGDGKVDILDLTLMGGNYNKTESLWTP